MRLIDDPSFLTLDERTPVRVTRVESAAARVGHIARRVETRLAGFDQETFGIRGNRPDVRQRRNSR